MLLHRDKMSDFRRLSDIKLHRGSHPEGRNTGKPKTSHCKPSIEGQISDIKLHRGSRPEGHNTVKPATSHCKPNIERQISNIKLYRGSRPIGTRYR